MDENKINLQRKSSEEISLDHIVNQIHFLWIYLKSKWLYYILACIIGGSLGFGYYYIQVPKYTADCIFILEEKSSSGSGLAGLASQFGFDIGGGGGSGLFAGDNLLEIIPSRNIVEKVLLSKVDSSGNLTLADLFLDFTHLKKSWSGKPRLSNISFKDIKNRNSLSLIQDSVLNLIYKQVVTSFLSVDWARKKASLIKISVRSENEQFSKYFTERVVNESKKLYIDLKTGPAQENVNRLQKRADSLLSILNIKAYESAGNQILNANPAIKVSQVPTEISLRDKTVVGTIYAEVVKNLETSKIILSQQTPVIQILDKAEFPLTADKTAKRVTTILGILLAVILMTLGWLIKYFIRS